MDIHCLCGELGHIDASFAYYVKCTACGRVYMSNGHIELVELTSEEVRVLKGLEEDFRSVSIIEAT